MEAVFLATARPVIGAKKQTLRRRGTHKSQLAALSESLASWYKLDVPETETVTSRDIWVAFDPEQETLPLKIIDYLETNNRLHCFFDKRDSNAGELKSEFLDRTMRACCYFILCFTENFYSKNAYLCGQALEYYKEKSNESKGLFILKIDEKCEIPMILKSVGTIISLTGDSISAPLAELVFLLLEIDPNISRFNLLDARFLGVHPASNATTRFYRCRHLNCEPHKVCFSSLPHEYSKELLHLKFVISPDNTPYLIWKTQLCEEICNSVFSLSNSALVRCYRNMSMASYISIQVFGAKPSSLQFNVVNICRQLIGRRNDQLRLLYSDSVSPVGTDWNDVTDNANLRIESTSGFYSFDAYKTGSYLVCAKKSDTEEAFSPSVVACNISRNINFRFRRLGLHWDWDVRLPMHHRQLDVSLYNMTLCHQDTLDYMLRFNSISIVIDSGPSTRLYVTLYYMYGDHELCKLPLTMDLTESLETVQVTLKPNSSWQLVAEFYVDKDRNKHLATIMSNEKFNTYQPKLDIIPTIRSDVYSEASLDSSVGYPFADPYEPFNRPPPPIVRLFLSQAANLFGHVWRGISVEESPDVAAGVVTSVVKRRAQSLIDQVREGDFIPNEILANLNRQPVGFTRKVNIQSKLLLRAIEQLINESIQQASRYSRTYEVSTDSRIYEVSPDSRTYEVSTVSRTHEVSTDPRTYEASTDPRTYEACTDPRTDEEERGTSNVTMCHNRTNFTRGRDGDSRVKLFSPRASFCKIQ